ncbi:hypothetical protein CCP4SC76_7790002 [Gammaproteobacteria bacterium]
MNIELVLSAEQARRWAELSLRDALALTFSHYVADSFDWSSAKFTTLVKPGLSDDELFDFRHGGKTSGKPHPDDWLIESICSLRSSESSFFFVEDWQLWPEAEIITKCVLPAVFNNKEVYFVVQEDDPRTSNSLFGICCANLVPLFHGFLIHGTPAPASGSTIDVEQLKTLARHVAVIYFGVYDGESYLVCSSGAKGN